MKRFNWQIWAGFLLSVFAFLSYPLLFVRFAATRDFPWANLLLFAVAVALVLFGVRRAWSGQKAESEGRRRFYAGRIVSAVLATISVVILGLFVFTFLIMARWLPASHGAPQVGQKAPDFTLADTSGTQVSLSELLSGNTPVLNREGQARIVPKGVLLIFYRGYW